MADTRLSTHPLILVAATTVILTCLLAIGVMTGIVPSPLSSEHAPAADLDTGSVPAQDSTRSLSQNAYVPAPQSGPARNRVAERAPAGIPSAGPVGGTQNGGASQTVAGGAPAATPDCTNCGEVTSVKAVRSRAKRA